MIQIDINLIPSSGGNPESLGTALIVNDGTGTESKGNYNLKIFKKGNRSIWKECSISGFPRKKFGPWDLMFRGLLTLLFERNSDMVMPVFMKILEKMKVEDE